MLGSYCVHDRTHLWCDNFCVLYAAKDVSDRVVEAVLREVTVEMKSVKILQLVPYMHRKFIITQHEHELLTNPQTTNLQRGNLLTKVLMGRNAYWLLKFCQCLLESYESECGLDYHYILFKRIKGECMYTVSLIGLTT